MDAAVQRGEVTEAAIAGRLRLLRDALGLSQREMAEIVGTSLNNYQHMEKKGRILPGYVHRLDQEFGADHNFVYKGDWSSVKAGVMDDLRRYLRF